MNFAYHNDAERLWFLLIRSQIKSQISAHFLHFLAFYLPFVVFNCNDLQSKEKARCKPDSAALSAFAAGVPPAYLEKNFDKAYMGQVCFAILLHRTDCIAQKNCYNKLKHHLKGRLCLSGYGTKYRCGVLKSDRCKAPANSFLHESEANIVSQMFYGKLPIMVLSEMVSNKQDSINAQIAAFILEHLEEIRYDSIRDLSAKTHVSISSISRFCRDMGLQDFMELKNLLASSSLNFEVCSREPSLEAQKNDYISAVQDSLTRVHNSLDMELLYQLANDIHRYPRVAIFGMLKAETVAMNLQSDLAMLGKISTTKIQFSEQVNYLSEVDADDLVIIFSYTGVYYDYGIPKSHLKPGNRPKINFITSSIDAKNDPDNHVIWFDSKQDQASHPYQLQLIGGLIAQCYAHLRRQEEK